MNPRVDSFLAEGCGRCEYHQTPQCKVLNWTEPLHYLRAVLLKSELEEEVKWSQPCYTLKGKNVIMLFALKGYCGLSFFKGSLLNDPHNILKAPGKDSQADRQLRFRTVDEVKAQEKYIQEYIQEAIELEKSGAKVDFKEKHELQLVDELIEKMAEDLVFKNAFEALTPGRQRGYNLYFSSAKQSSTRSSRIEKFKSKIFEGKGWNER